MSERCEIIRGGFQFLWDEVDGAARVLVSRMRGGTPEALAIVTQRHPLSGSLQNTASLLTDQVLREAQGRAHRA